MLHDAMRWMAGLALLGILLAAGCGGSTEPTKPEGSTGATGRGGPAADVGRPAPNPDRGASASPPKPAPTIPEVHLTDQDLQECFVLVGDMMPSIELPNLDGQTTQLSSLYGAKATIVFFWKNDDLFAQTNLEDLEFDFAAPRESQGVRVVGVAQDELDAAKRIANQAGVKFPTLVDAQGQALAKVGSERLMPRIYLLDAQGKILWFDVEFSQSTTRELTTALDVAVGPAMK